MKAIVWTKYGPPEVLQLQEVEKPVPKENEVLVKVYATTVNRTDCGFLRAKPFFIRLISGLTKPKRTSLGNEFAGKIEAVGKDVSSFDIGDNVFGYDDKLLGAHAEYMTTPEDGLITTMPVNMSYEEAAPITEGAHYALSNIRKANIIDGQSILIIGATGAIGSAAVQLVKHIGAHVTAVCDSKNMALVKSLGADVVIDYTNEDFTKNGQTYDVVFDSVGKSSYGRCKEIIKPGGTYMSTELGFLAQNTYLGLWTSIFSNKKVMLPIPKNSKEDVIFFRELIEAGEYKPVIDRTYPLEQIVEATRYVETGQKTGNVVIIIDHNDEN